MRVREQIVDNYSLRHIERMNEFRRDLWAHPELIPELPEDTANEGISYLLGITCQATHIGPIMVGRRALYNIPRPWLVERIEEVAEKMLNLQNEWDFQRLLEIFYCLDLSLAQSLAKRGLSSKNPCIIEAAQDFLGDSESYKKICKNLNDPLP